jgi:hypothetical protein
MKHFKKATRELEEALRLNPNHTGAQERLAMAKRMINQDSQMINQDSHRNDKNGSPVIQRNRPSPRAPSKPVIIITPNR